MSTLLQKCLNRAFVVLVVLFGTTSLSFAVTHKPHHHAQKHHHHVVHHTHSLHHAHVSSQHSQRFVHTVLHQSLDNNSSNETDDHLIKIDSLSDSQQNANLPVPSIFQDQPDQQSPMGQDNFSIDEESSSADTQASTPTTSERLVVLVHKAMSELRHTSYRFGGDYFDLSRGIYEEDCSGYVDQLLGRAEPEAYATLTEWTHSSKPSSFDYYDFFKRLPNQSWHFWQRIKDVARLKPGSILVFRYHGHSRYGGGGHVMVVMSQPVPVENQNDTFLVRVSDSAFSGHSDDTRSRHTSGVGIGTLLLKVNPFTHEPNAYAWRLSGWLEHVDVAMAEPVTPA